MFGFPWKVGYTQFLIFDLVHRKLKTLHPARSNIIIKIDVWFHLFFN